MKNSLYHLCPMWLLACLQGFVISVLLTACSGNPKVDAVIACADSLMASRPDSALHLLDSVEAQMADAPKSVRMRYQLLRHKAMNKAYVTFTSDSVMNEVVEYYDNKGDANDQLLAHYLLGCVYRDLDQVPHAVDCYQDAIAKADTLSADCDYQTVSCVYSQMAWLFHQQLLLSEEITARNNASYYALRANKNFYAIYNRDLSVSAFILQNNNDSAVALLQKVQKQYRENGYKQEELLSSLTLVYLYVERLQRFAEAKILIDRFEKESDLFDSHHELPPSKRQFYYYKGKYFEGINRLDSAEYYYRKVYRPNMTPIEKNPMYKGLLNVFRLRHQSDSIAKYSVLYCNANDSSVIIKDQQQTAQLAAAYQYNYYQKKALENEQKAHKREIMLNYFVFAAIIIVASSIVLGKRYIKKQKEKESKYQDEMEKLVQAQADLLALRSEQSVSHALLSQKEQQIKSLQETTEQYRQKIHSLQHYALNDRLQQAPVTVRLQHYLRQNPYQLPTFDDWKELKMLINHEIPSFYDTLNAEGNNLNDFEYDVCVLIRLQFSLANIAKLKKCSGAYITQIRKGIYEKIFKKEGLAGDLDKYIQSLS